MSKKVSLIILCVFIAIAVVFGLILVNKGDGPVMGTIISSIPIDSEQGYKNLENEKSKEVFIIRAEEINKLVEKYKKSIPQGKDLYVNLNLVECIKGTKIKVKWICNKSTVKEEEKTLLTDQKGIIWYKINGSMVIKGDYDVEGYIDNNKIFTENFNIE